MKHKGFTITELLVVIAIIAILVVLSIGIRSSMVNRGYDTAVKSDLATLKKKLDLWLVHNGTYLSINNSTPVTALEFKATSKAYATTPTTTYNLLFCAFPPAQKQFTVVAMSKSGNKFIVSDDSAAVVQFNGAWLANDLDMCISLGASNGNRGYAADDAVTGPWRPWTGVPK